MRFRMLLATALAVAFLAGSCRAQTPQVLPTPPQSYKIKVIPNVPASGAVGATAPAIYWYHLGSGLKGRTVKFVLSASEPCNLALYGPNPATLSGATGRGRAPKVGQGDATSATMTLNLVKGEYFLVVRKGLDGPPPAHTVTITESIWNPF